MYHELTVLHNKVTGLKKKSTHSCKQAKRKPYQFSHGPVSLSNQVYDSSPALSLPTSARLKGVYIIN